MGCGTIICIAAAGDIGICHADCHWDKSRNALPGKGCGSGFGARLFPGERDGLGLPHLHCG